MPNKARSTGEYEKEEPLVYISSAFHPKFCFLFNHFMLNMVVSRLQYVYIDFVATVKHLDSVIATFNDSHQIEPFIHFTGCLYFLSGVWVGIFFFFFLEQLT